MSKYLHDDEASGIGRLCPEKRIRFASTSGFHKEGLIVSPNLEPRRTTSGAV